MIQHVAPAPRKADLSYYHKQSRRQQTATLFLPYCGEFGCMILSHIRFVHSFPSCYKIVCCQPGEEIYYPSADEFDTQWDFALPDDRRVGINEHVVDDPRYAALTRQLVARHRNAKPVYSQFIQLPEGLNVKFPLNPSRRLGLRADIVLAPRWRAFCTERNFDRWEPLAAALADAGFTLGVVGRRDVSAPIPRARVASWNYDNPHDAAVELLQNCRVYVGTDTGPTHLAAFLDVPTIAFGNFGFLWAAQQANRKYFKEVEDGWMHPEEVVTATLAYLGVEKPVAPFVTPSSRTLGFDAIYWINRDDRPDRRAYMERELARLGLDATRVAATTVTDPRDWEGLVSPGVAGCLASHRQIVARAKAEGRKNVLILEDDCFFVDRFVRRAEKAVANLMRIPDWDLFYFQSTVSTCLEGSLCIKKIPGSWLTHAVAVNARFYDRYLEYVQVYKAHPLDRLLLDVPANKWATWEPLVTQRRTVGIAADDSDIVPKKSR